MQRRQHAIPYSAIESHVSEHHPVISGKEIRMNQHSDYCVLLVDDHQMVRQGLKSLTHITCPFTVRWLEASNLSDALEIFGKHTEIDLVLIDLNLSDSKGLTSVREFLFRFPGVRLAVYSATEDEFIVRQALSLGAIGFVPKSASVDAVLALLESLLITARDIDYDPDPQGTLSPRRETPGSAGSQNSQAYGGNMNSTQIKVLELVLAGLSNKEIAAECNLALGTVKNMVSSIMLVMGVNSRSHLISLFQ